MMNGQTIGDIWDNDLFYLSGTGTQGTFYYENAQCEGLNGDTANTTMYQHDAIAVVNDYFNADLLQNLFLYRVESHPEGGANPHPSFTITYTPECPVVDADIERAYTYCRGGEVQLNAEAGYDNYEWTPSNGLSDANIANPLAFPTETTNYNVKITSSTIRTLSLIGGKKAYDTIHSYFENNCYFTNRCWRSRTLVICRNQ